MDNSEWNNAIEAAAQVSEKTNVLHGDHYASYSAPSTDGPAIAKAIRGLKK